MNKQELNRALSHIHASESLKEEVLAMKSKSKPNFCLIAKRAAVCAAALALLRIRPQHVVWDIGAGSGAVALEASVLAHEGRVVAVERSAGRAMGIQENRRRFGAAAVCAEEFLLSVANDKNDISE